MIDGLKIVIPVREGSSRIKEKVLLPLGGKTLLGWKIEQLKQVVPTKSIVVSTNSKKLMEIGEELGTSIHIRSEYLSKGHDASFSEVITGIVKEIDAKHIAWATVVVPLMRPSEYEVAFQAYTKYVIDSNINDSLVTVNKLKEYFWTKEGAFNYQANKNHTISQDLEPLYRVTNGLYMAPRDTILAKEYFLGDKPYLFEVPKIAGIDIDEIEDYNMSKHLLHMYFDAEFINERL